MTLNWEGDLGVQTHPMYERVGVGRPGAGGGCADGGCLGKFTTGWLENKAVGTGLRRRRSRLRALRGIACCLVLMSSCTRCRSSMSAYQTATLVASNDE